MSTETSPVDATILAVSYTIELHLHTKLPICIIPTRGGNNQVPISSGSEHFDIHASVVFQLGESLITDSVQALVELVKNSYDADASYCKLTISTEKVADPESSFAGSVGSITIEDDGT